MAAYVIVGFLMVGLPVLIIASVIRFARERITEAASPEERASKRVHKLAEAATDGIAATDAALAALTDYRRIIASRAAEGQLSEEMAAIRMESHDKFWGLLNELRLDHIAQEASRELVV